MDFRTISSLLADSPELTAALDYEGLITYIDLVRILKHDLTRFSNSNGHSPPEHLPVAIHNFLRLSLNLDDEVAKLAWATLRDFAWDYDPEADDLRKSSQARLKYLKLFLEHGSCHGVGKYLLLDLFDQQCLQIY
jgi:hypothetical protein